MLCMLNILFIIFITNSIKIHFDLNQLPIYAQMHHALNDFFKEMETFEIGHI